MCDIRYFKSAYHCYDMAANLMKFYKNDEMYLNDVAYNLQQCIEKTLKAFLECKGGYCSTDTQHPKIDIYVR